jgi:hypothetical protein
MVPQQTTAGPDDGSFMLGLVLVACGLSVFWFSVGLVLGWWLL